MYFYYLCRRFLRLMVNDKAYSGKLRVIGYAAGIASGISYGMNPLFAKPLLESGVPVLVMLFYRYSISAVLLFLWITLTKGSFRTGGSGPEKTSVKHRLKGLGVMAFMGISFACSSLTLFNSYNYIPSGLATTLVYLYPAFVALTMVFLKVYPSWQVWVAIAATFLGIVLLSVPSGDVQINIFGVFLAALSALCCAFYLVTVNVSKTIRHLSETTITFYALSAGAIFFYIIRILADGDFSLLTGVDTAADWFNLIGLAIVPTMISLLTLAVSSRSIGPTKTSVLGVFEPLSALMVGVLLFDEPLTLQMTIGICICIAAVLFMILSRRGE